MAWTHLTTSHYLIQYQPSSIASYGITRLQWIKHHSLKVSPVSSLLAEGWADEYSVMTQSIDVALDYQCLVCKHHTLPGFNIQGPILPNIFHHKPNFRVILFWSHPSSPIVIITNFCTWHNSCAVMACAKVCCNIISRTGITPKLNFSRIWIGMDKSRVKQTPGHPISMSYWPKHY